MSEEGRSWKFVLSMLVNPKMKQYVLRDVACWKTFTCLLCSFTLMSGCGLAYFYMKEAEYTPKQIYLWIDNATDIESVMQPMQVCSSWVNSPRASQFIERYKCSLLPYGVEYAQPGLCAEVGNQSDSYYAQWRQRHGNDTSTEYEYQETHQHVVDRGFDALVRRGGMYGMLQQTIQSLTEAGQRAMEAEESKRWRKCTGFVFLTYRSRPQVFSIWIFIHSWLAYIELCLAVIFWLIMSSKCCKGGVSGEDLKQAFLGARTEGTTELEARLEARFTELESRIM